MKLSTTFVLFLCITAAIAQTDIVGETWGVWDASGSPYRLLSDTVIVPAGNSLVILPGVEVQISSGCVFVIDNGAKLIARGERTDSIYFTASDISRRSNGIVLNHSVGCTLTFCRIEYSQKGGLRIINNSPLIASCNIINNTASALNGGGISINGGDPVITYCNISGNSASGGGGISADNNSNPMILLNTISDNTADRGGGIYFINSWGEIRGNKIADNISTTIGGGIYCFHIDSNTVIVMNTITDNEAQRGAGIFCPSGAIIEENLIANNDASQKGGGIHISGAWAHITRNLIKGNTSSLEGGGILCKYGEHVFDNNIITENRARLGSGGGFCFTVESKAILINNTIVGNSAANIGGAIYCYDNSYPILFNNIIWENSPRSEWEIYLDVLSAPAQMFVAHTLIDTTKCTFIGAAEFHWGPEIINGDPIFVESDTLFHIRWRSPCVNKGAEFVVTPVGDTVWAPHIDFEGELRPQRTEWDIGADEFPYLSITEHEKTLPKYLDIAIKPNPFNSSCEINAPEASRVDIIDLNGRIVHTMRTNLDIWHPSKNIGSGLYTVRATRDGIYTTTTVIYLK